MESVFHDNFKTSILYTFFKRQDYNTQNYEVYKKRIIKTTQIISLFG